MQQDTGSVAEDTTDLLTTGASIPGEAPGASSGAEREKFLRGFGKTAGIGGAALTTVTLTTAAVGAALIPGHVVDSLPLLGIVAVAVITMTLAMIGCGGMLLSGVEYLLRYNRSRMRMVPTRLTDLTTEVGRVASGLTDLAQRVAAVEETVQGLPGYPQGVIDGVTMFRSGAIPSTRVPDDE